MTTSGVTAIVVTHDSRRTVSGALEALRPAHVAGWLRCLVVDNQSADGTPERVRRGFPWVTVVETGANLGFGRACNVGIARARDRYVLLLNPDAVLPVEALARLVAFLDARPRAGLCAPAIREPGDALQHAGGLPSPRELLRDAAGRGPRDGPRRPVEPGAPPFGTDWLCGAVLLLRRAMLQQIGGFDPAYFLYFEETDLCRRAAANGWELWAVGEAVGAHTNAESARQQGGRMLHGCIAEHYYRSRFHYLRRHHGWPRAVAAELGELAILAARAVARTARGRDAYELAARLRAPILGRPRGPAAGEARPPRPGAPCATG